MRLQSTGLGLALLVAACGPAASPEHCDPQAIRAVQAARANRSEVTLCGTVVRVGRIRRTRSGAHRILVVDVGAGDRIDIDANIDVMGNFPVRAGETTVVRGEYYYDAPGRDGVHWTHRTTHGTHPAGFIVLAGVTYR